MYYTNRLSFYHVCPKIGYNLVLMSLDEEFEQVKKWLAHCSKEPVHRFVNLYNSGVLLEYTPELADQSVQAKCDWTLRYILTKLVNIQTASIQAQSLSKDQNVISIALVDMKLLNALMHLLVVYGIYPSLDPGVGLPLKLRTKGVPGRVEQDPIVDGQYKPDLEAIVLTLRQMLDTKGDVRDLLLLGTYNGDLICVGAQLDHNQQIVRNLPELMKHIDTFSLYTSLTSLLNPQAPQWFGQKISHCLAQLPLMREDAVTRLLEFAGNLREKDQVSINQLEPAIRVLKSVPKDCSAERFYQAVDKQLFEALVRLNSPVSVAAGHVISLLFRDKPSALQPLVSHIAHAIVAKGLDAEKTITQTIDVLCTFCKDAEAESFMVELRKHVVVPLWAMVCFINETKRANKELLTELLIASLRAGDINNAANDLLLVINNLLVDGIYTGGSGGGIVGRSEPAPGEEMVIPSLDKVEERVALFVKALSSLNKPPLLSRLFVRLIQEWLAQKTVDAFILLVYARILEDLADNHKEELIKSSTEVMDLVMGILTNYVKGLKQKPDLLHLGQSLEEKLTINADQDSDDEDMDDNDDDEEQGPIKLSIPLLPHLLDSPQEITNATEQLLYLRHHGPASIRLLAQRAIDDLDSRQAATVDDDIKESDTAAQVLAKALHSLKDRNVPVRAHGLYVIRHLIKKDSSVTSSAMACKIYVNALKDDDSFVYLNAIRGLETCADAYGAHPVLSVLLARYSDEVICVEEKLRNGEAILRIIELKANTMIGQCLDEVCSTMLNILRAKSSDPRLHMSVLSIMGAACEVNAREISKNWAEPFIDCAVNILVFQNHEEGIVQRRAAVVLIGSLVQGLESLRDFPQAQVQTVVTRLEYAQQHDADSLVRFQCEQVLGLMAEKIN